MRLHHFSVAFAIFILAVVVITDIKTNNLKAIIDNREQIDRNLDAAIDDAATSLADVDDSNNIIINKEAAAKSFFMSLDSSFDVLSDKDSQEKLNLYVPVIAVTMENGFYVFYSDEYKGTDGYTYITRRWSEKFPYYYEDSDFIYSFTLGNKVSILDKNDLLGSGIQKFYQMDYQDFQTEDAFAAFRKVRPASILLNNESYELVQKGCIIKSIETLLAYYTSRHNKIAAQYGITYNFSLPQMSDDEWALYIDDIGLIVVFQGYPYGSEAGETYNRIASAGAKVSKNQVYYIEQKGWYLVYHREICPELSKPGIILKDEPYYDPIECAKQGAYQCPVCMENGIYAPEYNP